MVLAARNGESAVVPAMVSAGFTYSSVGWVRTPHPKLQADPYAAWFLHWNERIMVPVGTEPRSCWISGYDRPLRRRGPVAKHHLQQHHGAVGLRRHWPVLRFSDLCDNDAVRDGDSFDHCYADPVNHAVVNIDTFGDGYAKSVAEFNKQSERES